jgi:hypothetical protein
LGAHETAISQIESNEQSLVDSRKVFPDVCILGSVLVSVKVLVLV